MTLIVTAAVALGILVLVGWPVVAFTHYYFRRKYKISQALFLTLAPSMGAILVDLFISDGFIESRHLHRWLEACLSAFIICWFGVPYLILAIWTGRAFRRRQ